MTVDETRDEALGALYAADSRSLEEIDVTKVPSAAGVLADAVITAASTRWRMERMPIVDRNILRLGTYELLFTDLPIGVPISEAVELAKIYSTANSGSFVNGVLSAVADQRDQQESPDD